MTIQTFDAHDSEDAIKSAIRADGCVILKNIVPTSVVDRVADDLAPFEEQAEFGQGVFVGSQTKRLGGILRKSGSSVRLLGAPLILNLMNEFLGPYCERIRMNLSEAITIYPHQSAQFLHRDDAMFHAHVHGFRGEAMANVMWALSDFTPENGATRVVPGSHLWPREREATDGDAVQASMARGDALLYLGSVLHSGGENRSSSPRRGLILSYALGWLRQREIQYLVCPPDVARFLPSDIQDLIGYSVHRPNLGLFECEDPKELLSPRRKTRLGSRDFLTPELEALARTLAA